jgi:hypothetical protein
MNPRWIWEGFEKNSGSVQDRFETRSRVTILVAYSKHTRSILEACLNRGKTMVKSPWYRNNIPRIFQGYSNRSPILSDCLLLEESFKWLKMRFWVWCRGYIQHGFQRCLKDVWKMFERCLKDVWKMLEPCSSNVRTIFEQAVKSSEISRQCLQRRILWLEET